MFYKDTALENASILAENLQCVLRQRGLYREAETLSGVEIITPESALYTLYVVTALILKDENARHAQMDTQKALNTVLSG